MAKMISNLVVIRSIQLYRILKQLGWIYSIILLCVCLFAVIVVFSGKASPSQAYILSTVSVLITASLHFNRKDRLLFQSISKAPAMLYIAEYFLLQLLVYVYHIYNSNWLHVIALFIITLFIVLFTKKGTLKGIKSNRFKWPVKAYDFEWIAGLRRNYLVLLFMYLLAFCSVSVPFLSLLFVWYLSLSIASFYKEAEPLQVLLASEKKPINFLWNKILAHLKNYWQFILPVLLVYSYFHWEHISIVLLLVAFICIGLTFTVVNKYASYQPERFVGNDLLNAFVFGAVLIPFLAPLPIVLTIRSYMKAKKNLHNYLN